jgi:hypothetical protein
VVLPARAQVTVGAAELCPTWVLQPTAHVPSENDHDLHTAEPAVMPRCRASSNATLKTQPEALTPCRTRSDATLQLLAVIAPPP